LEITKVVKIAIKSVKSYDFTIMLALNDFGDKHNRKMVESGGIAINNCKIVEVIDSFYFLPIISNEIILFTNLVLFF